MANNSIFGNFPLMNPTPPAPAASGAPSGVQPYNPLQSALSTIGTGVGAGLSAYGQGQQQQQNALANAYTNQANMANSELNSDRAYQLNQAQAANSANPIGTDQNYAQKQAIMKAILGNAGDSNITPGDPAVAAAMGKQSGGLHIPQLSADQLNSLFGDATTQAAIAQHEKQVGQINPNAPVFDLGSIYGNSADGSQNAFTTDITNSNKQALQAQNAETTRQQQIIQNAIQNNINAAQKGSHSGLLGLLGSLGGSALSALPALLAL